MLRVLTYHRVANHRDYPWLDSRLISAEPKAFEQQMLYLESNYDVVSAEQVLNAFQGGKPLPKHPVMITFDDGYADFAAYAWPILNRHKMPATLFLATSFPNDPFVPFWWDRLYQAYRANGNETAPELKQLRLRLPTLPHDEAMRIVDEICSRCSSPRPHRPSIVDWDQVRRLAREGVTIASHTRRHAILTQLTLASVRDEIRGSLDDIRRYAGDPLPLFCYPAGCFSDDIVRLLVQEGIYAAFSTQRGHNDLRSCDRLRLRRINVTPRTALPVFRLRLHSAGDLIDRWRP